MNRRLNSSSSISLRQIGRPLASGLTNQRPTVVTATRYFGRHGYEYFLDADRRLISAWEDRQWHWLDPPPPLVPHDLAPSGQEHIAIAFHPIVKGKTVSVSADIAGTKIKRWDWVRIPIVSDGHIHAWWLRVERIIRPSESDYHRERIFVGYEGICERFLPLGAYSDHDSTPDRYSESKNPPQIRFRVRTDLPCFYSERSRSSRS
jgi:hypothetical protein